MYMKYVNKTLTPKTKNIYYFNTQKLEELSACRALSICATIEVIPSLLIVSRVTRSSVSSRVTGVVSVAESPGVVSVAESPGVVSVAESPGVVSVKENSDS